MPQRGTVSTFIEGHQWTWEGTMAVLAIAYLVLGFSVDSGTNVPDWALAVLAGVFVSEFAIRCWDAPSRYGYVRHHWLDLVSCIPLAGGLRGLRVLRLLRLGAAVRILVLAEHTAVRRGAARQSLWFLGPLLFLVWFGAAAAYWNFENGVNPHVHSFGDALYWAAITATTVGYGDFTPVTQEGRILSGALVFIGIGLIGFASARLTSRWLQASDGQAAVATRIESLEHEVILLRELLVEQFAHARAPATAAISEDGDRS
ncbi:MAG TPA: ion channel [Candidatus Dormibacteraeota bacterium]|jgi:voltage-gated potassium channel|nr:ion channel [Candidatus Dormibacteraeota bacterium]